MAETSGFFRSVNGDRKYSVSFLAKWAGCFVSNGVYNGELAVTAGENMQIIIPAGRAWVGSNGERYKYENDSNMVVAIANADGVLARKDTVVLRWDLNERNITAQVLTGTFSSNPVAPPIERTAEQYDLKLAELYLAPGTTAITQAAITDTRLDNAVCGIVTSIVDQVDTTTLYNQIQADLTQFRGENEAEFTAWFQSLQDILDENTAGNLLNLITIHTGNAEIHVTVDDKTKWSDGIVSTYTHTKNGTAHNLAGTGNNITFLAKAAIADGDTWTVNGQPVTATLQNGDPLPEDLFKAENWVTGVRLDGTKLGFKSAGSGKSDLNIFCQPTLPTDKFDGLVLLTTDKFSDIVTKYQFEISGEWKGDNTNRFPNLPFSLDTNNTTDGSICRYKGYIYAYVKGSVYKIDENTGTYTLLFTTNSNSSYTRGNMILVSGKLYVASNSSASSSSANYTECHVYDIATSTHKSNNLSIPKPSGSFIEIYGVIPPLLFEDPLSHIVYIYQLAEFHTYAGSGDTQYWDISTFGVLDSETGVVTVVHSETIGTHGYYAAIITSEVGYDNTTRNIYFLMDTYDSPKHYITIGIFNLDTYTFSGTLFYTTTSSSASNSYYSSVFLYSGKLYIRCLQVPSNMLIFDLMSKTFSLSSTCPVQTATIKPVQFDSKLYFFARSSTASNYVYDIILNTWTAFSKSPQQTASKYFMHYFKENGMVIFSSCTNAYVDGFITITEPQAENTLAILLEDNTNLVKLYTKKNVFLRVGVRNTWIYKNSAYQEYAGYLGNGASWNKFKN